MTFEEKVENMSKTQTQLLGWITIAAVAVVSFKLGKRSGQKY